jgi:hypothetical protein
MNVGCNGSPGFDVEKSPILARSTRHWVSSRFQRKSLKTNSARTSYSTLETNAHEAQLQAHQ